MSSSADKQRAPHTERFEAALPADLVGKRVLLSVPDAVADDLEPLLTQRGASEVLRWDPIADADLKQPGFDLAVLAELLQADPHPARIATRLWEALAPEGTLMVHSRVYDEPGKSQYARFVARSAGKGDSEWLPGRLTLRWSFETSGFDIARWLDAGEATAPARETDAYLEATRTGRYPSLLLATPTDPGGAA